MSFQEAMLPLLVQKGDGWPGWSSWKIRNFSFPCVLMTWRVKNIREKEKEETRRNFSFPSILMGFEELEIRRRKRKEKKPGRECIHSSETDLTFRTKPVPLWFRCQSQTLSVINPGTELTAKDLAFPVTNPAVEIIPSILRYNINRVCGEWLLHIVKRTMS